MALKLNPITGELDYYEPAVAGHDAATVSDTTSLNLSITGQEISGAVNFGTGAGVAAEGNHAHAGVYEPADATIVKTGNASWIDLTDGGATTLHSHAAGGAPFVDTTAIVMGSADATKLLRFEVDGFTAGATRVLTPPNADITLAGQNYANVFTAQQFIDGSSDQIQFRVQAHSTQTTNLHTWEKSTGAVMAYIDPSGRLYSPLGTSASNLFLGGAGNETATGTYNVGIGYNSMVSLTDGIQNVAIGGYALNSLNSGQHNFALGYQALQTLTSGSRNTAIGTQAMARNTQSADTIAIGYLAGWGNAAGVINFENVFIGTSAASAVRSGSHYNIAIGYAAGEKLNSDYNTFIGHGAASLNVITGSYSTLIGHRAGYSTTAANYTTAVGTLAAYSLTDGHNNVMLGYEAGRSGTTFTNNTLIGFQSGYSLTGSSNIFIGFSAGWRQTSGANLLIVDNLKRADIATEITNSIFYGVMASTPASQTLRINAATSIYGGLVGNEDGGTVEDFRWESDSYDALFVDASNNSVVVMSNAAGKIGFYGAPAVAQPAGATQAAPAAYVTGAFGLDSDAHMQALYDLVVAMRTALVNTGIMKGAA